MNTEVIELPKNLFEPLKDIAGKEQFPECISILSRYDNGRLTLNQQEAQHLVDLLVFEASSLNLKYPYRSDDHPNYSEDDADKWGDFCHSLLPHTLNCIKQHFEVEE